jgi:hypothetical protein
MKHRVVQQISMVFPTGLFNRFPWFSQPYMPTETGSTPSTRPSRVPIPLELRNDKDEGATPQEEDGVADEMVASAVDSKKSSKSVGERIVMFWRQNAENNIKKESNLRRLSRAQRSHSCVARHNLLRKQFLSVLVIFVDYLRTQQ